MQLQLALLLLVDVFVLVEVVYNKGLIQLKRKEEM
jgi:hypothetical protein